MEEEEEEEEFVDLTKDIVPKPKLYERDRWTIVELGTTCKDFSAYGHQLRMAGPSAEAFHIAMAEI
eukprot:3774170-Lingulodinium_polyedra.AAC.1